MLTLTTLSPPTFSLLTLIFIIFTGRLIDARIFIYGGCSLEKYPPNSPYEANKNSLLSSVAASSALTLFNAFTSSTAPPDAAVYGLYQCRGDLKARDCAACVADVISKVELLCPDTYGASLQLDGCYLRYEHTDFVGKLDTGLRYKKCGGGGGGNDVEFLRRRDDVLADLRGADGFRVSTAGAVEGYAQCLGDISAADCSDCLGEAVAKVKTLCGSAAAGDVFLAKCYARYWESGYYDSSDSSNQDDVGKTVAIAVGVVAGVAVLIVLLSFCRKAVG